MAKRAKTVLAGMDFESGAAERGFGTHRALRSHLRRKFGQSRAEGIRISVHREARADPYGGAPTGGPTKGD